MTRLESLPQHPGDPLTVKRRIAKADLVELRSLHVEVHVVLPREPDPPVHLQPDSHHAV